MRLTWLDRIRRLVRPRGRATDAAEVSGSQGRHRRNRRQAPGAPGDRPAAGQVRPSPGPAEADRRSGPDQAEGRPPTAESRYAARYGGGRGHDGQAVLDPAGWDESAPVLPGRGARERRGAGSGQPAVRAGAARARVREAPQDAMEITEGARPRQAATRSRPRWVEAAAPGRAAGDAVPDTRVTGVVSGVPVQSVGRARHPWQAELPFAAPHATHAPPTADGRRNCGSLEGVLWRQWDVATLPPAEV
ncbi:MAG: hypothetical protein ACRDOL_43820, partial [Streptosporangiaceae bacterium]